MLSEIRGKLVLDDRGCLLVRAYGSTYVVVWPAGYKPEMADGEVRVLTGEGDIVARVGHRVYMGGGETPLGDNKAVDERTEQELRKRCPGSYWVATPPVSTPGAVGSKTSGLIHPSAQKGCPRKSTSEFTNRVGT